MLKFIVCLCLIKNVIGVNDHLWHSYKFGNEHGNREELYVKKIKADENFTSGIGVIKWKSVSESGKAYAIGLKNKGITVLKSTIDNEKKLHIKSWNTEFDAVLTDLACFLNWNKKNYKKEFIAVISANENGKGVLKWMKFFENEKLEQFWQWNINKNITYLDVYNVEEQYILLVADNKTVDLYQFDCTERQDFWLMQVIDLHGPIKNTALTIFGQHYYLSLPRTTENFVEIFLYQKGHFVTYKNITSELVDFVTSFKIGYRSFLAINGYNAGIFRFTKNNGLIKEIIKDYNEDETEFWYPIRVRSHRDEIIVLAQRNLFHSTHETLHIALVTFNGKNFLLHEEVPCSFFGEEVNGLDLCMSGEESESGIIGLTEMSLGHFTSVLVPNKKAPSSLFTFELEHKILPDPVDTEIKHLKEIKLHLEQMIQDIKDEENEIVSNIKNADDRIVTNTKAASDEVDTLTAEALKQNQPLTLINPSDFEVEKIDLVSIKNDINIIWDELKAIKTKVEEMKNSIKGGEFFKTLHIEGAVEVQGSSIFNDVTVEMVNGQNWNDVVNDIVRIDNLKPVGSEKTFSSLEIKNLNSTIINGVKMQNVIFSHEKDITIKGDLIFLDSLSIVDDVLVQSGKINDVSLKDEIVLVDTLYKENIKLEEVIIANSLDVNIVNDVSINNYDDQTKSKTVDVIETSYLHIPGNIVAKNVNGENFDDFIGSIYWKNRKMYIPGKVKIATLHVQNASVDYLNNLKFPENYVFKQSEGYTKVTGEKFFDRAFANELIIRDVINDRNPDKMITLGTPQNLPGNFTFENLEITECLDVDGQITGEYVNKFLPNPTLLDTNIVKANLNFQNLEVEGNVIISGIINGTQFDFLLENIIYKDEYYPTINAIKEFPYGFTISNNLHLHSDSINNIPIDFFVTKDTEQTILSNTLNGNVKFQNLHLGGYFGDVNITELEDTTLKLNGEQFASSSLIFENDIFGDDVEVLETLNNIPIEDYYFKDGDRVILDYLEFENIHVENITVEGDVNGNLVDFDLEGFDRRRLSLSKNQRILSNFTINTLSTKDLEADFINDSPVGKLIHSDFYTSKIVEMLQEGQLKIKDLYINGSLRLMAFNGIDFDKVMENFAWKDKGNKFTKTVIIRGDVFLGDLQVDTLNNKNFENFMQNLVYKNESDVILGGTKIYENGFLVKKYIETDELNGIPVQNVLRKDTGKIQKILSPIKVTGDVIVDDAEVVFLNDVSMEKLAEIFHYVDGVYIIKGDLNFINTVEIENINFKESVNGLPAKEFFENIIYRDQHFETDGVTLFKNLVHIENNFGVTGFVNGLDLSEFYYGAVSVVADTEMDGTVIFAKPVEVKNNIQFMNDIMTKRLNGIDLENWKNNAVFVDKGLIPGNITFEKAVIKDDIKTVYFNNIDMESLIPLQTNQIITEKLQIETVRTINHVDVGQLVNGVILKKEFENSILDGTDQIIDSNIIFGGNIVVRNNLQSYGKINDHNLDEIVTTNTDQNLKASFTFNKPVVFYKDLQINGFLNGINITHWMNNRVKLDSFPQELSGKWFINGSVTFEGDVEGSGFLNGVDLLEMASKVEKKKEILFSEEKQLIDSYKNACEDVNYILAAAKNQIYFFKYLELIGEIKLNENIQSAYHFQFEDNIYLWLNTKKPCQSYLFILKPNGFVLLNTFESGSIQQVITIKDSQSLYFVTRGVSRECQISGTNIWKFDDNNLLLLQKIEDAIMLQDSLVPSVFYALHEKRVVEYKFVADYGMILKRVRQWNINGDNLAFVPRGLHTGLALRNGHKFLKLSRDNYEELNDVNFETDFSTIGDVTEKYYDHLPYSNESEIVVMNVGDKKRRKTLVAVASHEETSIKRRLDLIKIYEDVLSGVIFQNIPTYKPTSLTSLEFSENSETLLLFLENYKTLQIYEYKGIEGFKHKMSANMEGTRLFTINLSKTIGTKLIGVINDNTVKILETVMCGNRLQEEGLMCEL